MVNPIKEPCSPISSGGGGVVFETHVQALFAILMLAGGYAPCLRAWPIKKIKLQGNYKGYNTDDFIAFAQENGGDRVAKLLAQIKQTVAITANGRVFESVIKAAWRDFKNPEIFDPKNDMLALITGPLQAIDISDTRVLSEWARTSESSEEFIEKVQLAKFSSDGKRKKLDAFRSQLNRAKGENIVDDELWGFLKIFNLLGYDLDVKNGVILSLLNSVIGQDRLSTSKGLWAMVVDEVQFFNKNGGTITPDTISEQLKEAFTTPQRIEFPSVLAPDKEDKLPEFFADKYSHTSLTMALMLGGWKESSEGDIACIEKFINSSYKDWIEDIRTLFLQPDSLLSLNNDRWEVLNRLELWKILGPQVFDEHLSRFKAVALEILRERNPELDLEPENRFSAQVREKVLEHSRKLREGIATTLAIVGNHPDFLSSCSNVTRTIKLAVREILQDANWERWDSLHDVLTLLAEAAPDEFLDAVENSLRTHPSPLKDLFAQERAGITGRSYICSLLWALESLAWEPRQFGRVITILGELASIDPGGNYSNRPANSLVTIFLPWRPQTLAPIPSRIDVMKALNREFPDVAWKLLLLLLPNGTQYTSGSLKPKWRETIPDDHEYDVTYNEYWEQCNAYSLMVIEHAKADPIKLSSLLEHIDNLSFDFLNDVLEYLKSEEVAKFDGSIRFELWNKLTQLISHHRHFPDAKWSLSSPVLSIMEEAANAIAPESPTKRFAPLFSKYARGQLDGDGDIEEQQARFHTKRQQAVQQILQTDGLNALVEFARQVESPHTVGQIAGTLDSDCYEKDILPSLLLNSEEALSMLSKGYALERFSRYGWTWVNGLSFDSWRSEEKGVLLACLPFVRDTWERVTELLPDDESPYWRQANVWPYGSDKNYTHAIRRLIEFKRPNAALRCIAVMQESNQAVYFETAISALNGVTDSSSDKESIDQCDIISVIKALQEDKTTPLEELAKIEWKFMSLLVRPMGDMRPIILERSLAKDPEYYCNAIRTVYRSTTSDSNQEELTEGEKAVAENVFDLLYHWKYPPGLNEDNTFDGDHFNRWLSYVKTECTKSGHLDIALSRLGHVLKYCPEDPDGLWLPRSVAEALNKPDANIMREGFQTELYNSRGVSRFTEGKSEIRLAEEYEKRAREVEEYPRLATEMRKLADLYRREGKVKVDEPFD